MSRDPADGVAGDGTIRGIFFDLFGTLFLYADPEAAWSAWLAAYHEGYQREGLEMDRERFAEACDGFFSEPEPELRVDGESLLEARIRRLGDRLSVPLSSEQARRIADHKVEAWQRHIPCDPETPRVLQALAERGYTLAVISNFDQPAHVHELLARHGLDHHLDQVLVSAEVGAKKPDPRIFHLALERTGLTAEQVIHVGDSRDDTEGAAAAAIRPILIRRERNGDEPTIHDFRARPEATRSARRGAAAGAETIHGLPELLQLLPRCTEAPPQEPADSRSARSR